MRFTQIKDHPDYGVTKTGRIYSRKLGKWRELKPQIDTDGYQQVRLCEKESKRLIFVHRIVAETFIEKPLGCHEVNHIDGNKLNNCVNNLEWCTRRDNIIHAHDNRLIATRTPVVLTNIETNEKTIFKGQHEAARVLGINQGNLNHALKRHNGTCEGYQVCYFEGGDTNE